MTVTLKQRTHVGGSVWWWDLPVGALAGIAGAMLMGVFAMIAGATYLASGFFTPLYHIASSVYDPGGPAMMASMDAAKAGDMFTFVPAPALVGLGIHMGVGLVWGVLFLLIAHVIRLRGLGAVVAGVAYGLAVMAVMSFVTLPITANLFGGGTPIRDMPELVGWTTFTIEHALYGLVLGIGAAIAARGAAGTETVAPARPERRAA